jgi:hypothetical protein
MGLSVAALDRLDLLEHEGLLMELGAATPALILPGGDMGKALIVALRLTLRRLMLDAEMAATGLLAREGIMAHQLGKLQEVRHAPGVLERLVEVAR